MLVLPFGRERIRRVAPHPSCLIDELRYHSARPAGDSHLSIRSRLLSLAIKVALKPMLHREDLSIENLRARIATSDQMSGKIPAHVASDTCQLGGVPCRRIRSLDANAERVVVYFHGGGYVLPGAAGHALVAAHLSRAARCEVVLVDYRLAPEAPFPAAVEDALAVVIALAAEGIAFERMVLAGDSAGGGLAAATLLNLKNQGLPQPAAAALISPWLDLALTGDSMKTNHMKDPMLSKAVLDRWAKLYLGERDPLAPLASPLFGDLAQLAPVLVHVGETEVLLGDAEQFVDHIIDAGGSAALKVFSNVPHVFQLLIGRVPEAKTSLDLIGQYILEQFEAGEREGSETP